MNKDKEIWYTPTEEFELKCYKKLKETMDNNDLGYATVPQFLGNRNISVQYIWGIAKERKVIFPIVTNKYFLIQVTSRDDTHLAVHDINNNGFQIYDFEEGKNYKYVAMIFKYNH